MTTSNSFAASAAHKPLDPNYPEGDLYTRIEYLDLKGETVIATSGVHVGSNTAGGGLQIETPNLGDITYQLVRDVTAGTLTTEQAQATKFVRIPDFGNMHMTRFDMETYAALNVFDLYENAQEREYLATAKAVYPAGHEAHLRRRAEARNPAAAPATA